MLKDKRIAAITVGILIVGLAGVIFTGSIYQSRIAEQQNEGIQVAVKEKKLLLNEKISYGLPIDVLVVGGPVAMGRGVGSYEQTWLYQLEKQFEQEYQLDSRFHVAATGSGYIRDSLVNYSMADLRYTYDLVIMGFGQSEQHTTPPQQFTQFYEQWIRTIMLEKNNPQIVMLREHDLTNAEYEASMYRLAEYYHLSVVDIRSVFANANIRDLTIPIEGESYPNKEGQRLFADAVFESIKQQMDGHSIIDTNNTLPPPLHDINPNPRLVTNLSNRSAGFTPAFHSRMHYAHDANEYLEYYTEGTMLGVMVLHTYDGGIADIYIDGVLAAQIDCYGKEGIITHWIDTGSDTEPARRTVKIVAAGRKSEDSLGTKVSILGVVSNPD